MNSSSNASLLAFGPCVEITNNDWIDFARLLLLLPYGTAIGILITYSIRRDFRMYMIDIFTLSIAYINIKAIAKQVRFIDPWVTTSMQQCILSGEDWTFPDYNFISWMAFTVLFIIYKRKVDKVQPLNGYYIIALVLAQILYCSAQLVFGRMSLLIFVLNFILACLTTLVFLVLLLDAYFNIVVDLFPDVEQWTSVDLVVNIVEPPNDNESHARNHVYKLPQIGSSQTSFESIVLDN